MSLNERINSDMKEAMKSGERTRLETLRTIRAHIIELQKRGTGAEITVDDELSVLMTAVKKRKEAIELYDKAGRTDLAEQERRELDIISTYLPRQVSREDAERLIGQIIVDAGATTAKDFGKVMPLAMRDLKGKFDGKTVQEIVKAKLGG
ncbi:MAG TPA: glutamyl-tRNA amidotransferase [Bacteroidetes bacterium]|nr:glutamyl-tRNA amidotransferase [Bacteroidota bacterium]